MSRCSGLRFPGGGSLGGTRRSWEAENSLWRLSRAEGRVATWPPSPRVSTTGASGGVVGSGLGVAMQSQSLWLTTSSPRPSLGSVSDSQQPPPCPAAGSALEEQQQSPPPSIPAPEHIEAAARGCSTSCNAANSAMSRDPVGRRAIGSRDSWVRPLRTTCRFESEKARIFLTGVVHFGLRARPAHGQDGLSCT